MLLELQLQMILQLHRWRLFQDHRRLNQQFLFHQQNCLGCKGVVAIAAEKQFDTTALQTCMKLKATMDVINTNRSEASLHNINATPTFVIGPTRRNGSLDGRVVEGALPWSTFKSIIDKALLGLE